MTSLRSRFVPAALLVATAIAQPALAQDGKFTASVNFGAQTGSGDLSQTITPTIYGEPAKIDIGQTYGSGPLFDLGGSYMFLGKFGGKLGVGMSYSHTSGDGNVTIAAQIPDPLYADLPRSASAEATGLTHSENAVHVALMYRFPATHKLDVTVGLGPTFFSVKQDLVTTLTVTEVSTTAPFGPPTVTPVVEQLSNSPVGIHFSVDATYMVTKTFGAGLLMRFAHGTATITRPDGTSADVKAGGFQIAGGVRVRF